MACKVPITVRGQSLANPTGPNQNENKKTYVLETVHDREPLTQLLNFVLSKVHISEKATKIFDVTC